MPTAKVFEHSKELIKAFAPIRFFLMIIGQMPFEIKKKKDNTYSFKFTPKSASLLLFLLMFTITTLAYIFVTLGILSFIFNDLSRTKLNIKPTKVINVKDPVSGENEVQLWERYYTRKEMVPVFVIWSWMTISFVGSLQVIIHGKFYVHYMNYFNRVVQMLDMDMTPGIKNYLWRNNLITITVAGLLIVGFSLQIWKFEAIGHTAKILANFVLRMFKFEIETMGAPQRLGWQIFGLLIMIYALVGSRANIIQFLFFSQLLKNGAKIWNERFTRALEFDENQLKELAKEHQDQFHRRLDLKHILKDHLILVQLFRMTEAVFGVILFTFYTFEIISMVMEIYQLAALGGFGTTVEEDEDDIETATQHPDDDDTEDIFEVDKKAEWDALSTSIVCLVLMLQHVFIAISTTSDAAAAYEQAMEGFNILRQHGFMYCRNKSDRNFVLSMFMSFTKRAPMHLTAGGYFTINRALLVGMTAAVINWAVSIYQTKVDQWK